PYAWLNMKVKAAHDWLRMRRGEFDQKEFAERHAFDVYILVAMLTAEELETAEELAKKYARLSIAEEIKSHTVELYGSQDEPGFIEAERQARQASGLHLDYSTFWEGIRRALGIEL